MTKRLASVTFVSPNGHKIKLDASSETASLTVERYTPNSNFCDVRDDELPKHEDGFARCIATIPSTWAMLPTWVDVPAGTAEDALDIPAFLRAEKSKGSPQFPHATSLSPLKGCACGSCNDARATARFAGNNSDA